MCLNTKQLCDVLFETLLLGLWHKYQSMRDTIFPLGCEIAKHAFKSLPETPNIGSSDPRPGNRSVSLVTATSPRGSFFLLTHSTRRGEADHQKDISLKRVRKLFVKS